MQGKKYIGLVVLATTALMACNSNHQSVETKDTATVVAVDTSAVTLPGFKDEKLQDIYTNYIKLKDQLVASNYETTKSVASDLSVVLAAFKGCESAVGIAAEIASAENIKEQRAAFTDLNVEIIPIFKHAELSSGTIYVQHCPMANKGNGGDWLSSEKKIQNPYYGNEMMECGRVAEEIKAK